MLLDLREPVPVLEHVEAGLLQGEFHVGKFGNGVVGLRRKLHRTVLLLELTEGIFLIVKFNLHSCNLVVQFGNKVGKVLDADFPHVIDVLPADLVYNLLGHLRTGMAEHDVHDVVFLTVKQPSRHLEPDLDCAGRYPVVEALAHAFEKRFGFQKLEVRVHLLFVAGPGTQSADVVVHYILKTRRKQHSCVRRIVLDGLQVSNKRDDGADKSHQHDNVLSSDKNTHILHDVKWRICLRVGRFRRSGSKRRFGVRRIDPGQRRIRDADRRRRSSRGCRWNRDAGNGSAISGARPEPWLGH